MGTECRLGAYGDQETFNGQGIHLLAYEMSGLFSVYTDVPKSSIDFNDDDVRVNIWDNITPYQLMEVGLRCMNAAFIGLDDGGAYKWSFENLVDTVNAVAEELGNSHKVVCHNTNDHIVFMRFVRLLDIMSRGLRAFTQRESR